MDEEPDLKLIEEINRQYDGNYEELTVPAHRRRVFFFLKVVTLVLVAVFFFTVAARGLYIFTGPYLSLLRESWELAGDPSVQELREAVVLLSVENHAGVSPQQLSGTGFNIDSEGLIVTNRHLVEDAVSMTVSFPGRGIFVAADWFYSPVVDLAVVKLQAADLPVVKLSEVSATPGEEILVIGNPLRFVRLANRGLAVGHIKNYQRETPFLVIEALIYPGSSGSPVFNQEGYVQGVVFATLQGEDPEAIRGLAVDVIELRVFLEEFSTYIWNR